ncbi:MAG: hypothetical protein JXQ90_06735 [Cyclobacteriaceae bacterium]
MKFKTASPKMITHGARNVRVLSDVVGDFWTVVWEFEVEAINHYFEMSQSVYSDASIYNRLDGYQDYIISGHREILQIE